MSELLGALGAGAIAGLGVAIPLGPVGILILETGLRRGWRHGAAAGLGAATVDGLYAAISVVAGSAVAAVIAPIAGPIRVVSAGVLVVIAVRGLLALRRRPGSAGSGETPAAEDLGPSLRRTWVSIVGLTAVNPLTVVYFSALVLGLPALGSSPAARAAFTLGCLVASGAWQLLLATIGAAFHRRLSERARTATGLAGDLLVLALAANILRSVLAG